MQQLHIENFSGNDIVSLKYKILKKSRDGEFCGSCNYFVVKF